ncbi:MAG: ABC transporter ATP-binding protein [Clostridiales Family XIII bacterium]|jgi:ABC-2 type transport system ATP-binding protein|nr:ABC transporter ATP-binding protein [Clostridiales Family XIII bacterium]
MNAIEVRNLRKSYHGFTLDVSFSVPTGFACGFVGRNGAGKTTTLKCLLGMAIPDGGEISILGKPFSDVSLKADLGVMFEQPYYQEDWTVKDVEKVLRPYYEHWDGEVWRKYLDTFSLPERKKFKDFSRGMKMKLGISAALAHDAKLLLLDEPTGGLDPVVREEIIDTMRDYLLDETKTIFFSTHITSDLEKFADRIIFISDGKIVFDDEKDVLLEKYALVRGNGLDELRLMDRIGGLPQTVVAEAPTLDDIVVYFERGKVG